MAKKLKPLSPHALEMLRLIGSRGNFWTPQDRSDGGADAAGSFSVFVCGPWSTAAITSLSARGLVEIVPDFRAPGSMKWARKITPAGRAVLDVYLAPLIVERQRALQRHREKAESDGR